MRGVYTAGPRCLLDKQYIEQYVEIVAQLDRIVSVYKNVTTVFKNISFIIHNCIDMFTSI